MKKHTLIALGLTAVFTVGATLAAIEAIESVNIRAAERGYDLANENLYNHKDEIQKLKAKIKEKEAETPEKEKELNEAFCDLGRIKDAYDVPFTSEEVQKKYLNDCLGLN